MKAKKTLSLLLQRKGMVLLPTKLEKAYSAITVPFRQMVLKHWKKGRK